MFGDALWNHLVVEVTFWRNGENADNLRKNGNPDTYTNDLMATKLNELISDTANVPQNLNIPTIFIDPVFDIESLVPIPENVPQAIVDYFESSRQPLLDLQENEISKLKEKIFESNLQGFGCSDNCKGVIPPKAGRPFLVDASMVGTISHGSDLTIKCLVPIPFDAIQTGDCDHVCEPGWILNSTHEIPANKIKHETDPSRFMTTNTLQLLSLDKDQDPGSYQCYGSHCKKHNSSYFSCNIVKSETTTNLTILFIPPEIKVEDKRANKFHCRQNVTFSNGIDVRFTVHRHERNTGKTLVLYKGDFGLVTDQITDGQGFRTQTFSERLFSSDSEVCRYTTS